MAPKAPTGLPVFQCDACPQDVVVKLALKDRRFQKFQILSGNTVISKERRDHVDEIAPEFREVFSVRYGGMGGIDAIFHCLRHEVLGLPLCGLEVSRVMMRQK